MSTQHKDYINGIPNAERRYATHGLSVQKRAADPADEPNEKEIIIRGYAALFNVEADLGYAKEIIMPGAFDECLANDVRCLFNHDPNIILGRGNNKPTAFGKGQTLRYGVDSVGLWYEVVLDTSIPTHYTLSEAINRNDINQSSFAFLVKEQSWVQTEQGQPNIRKILKFKELLDVSPVTYPAYEDTTIGMRSLTNYQTEINNNDAQEKMQQMQRTLQQVNITTSNLMLGVV